MTPLEALQAALAGEHAAVYVYAVLGGRVSSSQEPGTAERLRSAYDVHRARRDHLRGVLADLDVTPAPAAAAYEVGTRSREANQLLAVARGVEERSAAVYAQLVSASTGRTRRWAIDALTDAAVRGLDLGAPPTDYPGLPEL